MKYMSCVVASAAMVLTANIAFAKPEIGEAAPDFKVMDTNGKEVSLSSLKGKTVVLEWTNHECPFVKKHYGSDNMQVLQKESTGEDVVWVSVISSGEGLQGYVEAAEANSLTKSRDAAPSHVLLDPSGELGKLYAAKTTPHMYIVNPEGNLAYMGGIDDTPSADKADVKTAKNYVRTALTEMKDGKEVTNASTRPYGCSVKYSS